MDEGRADLESLNVEGDEVQLVQEDLLVVETDHPGVGLLPLPPADVPLVTVTYVVIKNVKLLLNEVILDSVGLLGMTSVKIKMSVIFHRHELDELNKLIDNPIP